MKRKFSKILGVGLTLVMVLAMTAGFSLPAGASPDENEWSTFDYPTQGEDGGWFYDPTITGIRAIDQAINGDLYAYVNGLADLFLSTDGGRSWSETDYAVDLTGEGAIIDIACSSLEGLEETVYVTDSAHVYKSDDAGASWDTIADTSLQTALTALGGTQVITSLAVGYDRNDDPLVFVGTDDTTGGPTYNGGVLYIAEEAYPSVWTDLHFDAYGAYDVISIGVSPDFATDDMLLAVVTKAGDTDVVSNTGVVGDWDQVSDLVASVIDGASNICFPDDYADSETVFVGIFGAGADDDVYMVTDTPYDLDINGTTQTHVSGLDILGETDEATLVAGARDSTAVFYSTDGGSTWDETDKVPSGVDNALIVLTEDSVFATTGGTECGLSLSVDGGALFNQISLIATDIDQVTGVAFSNEYATDETMFMLTTDTTSNLDSLLRYDGSNWERVASTTVIGAANTLNMVGISPDYTTDTSVFLGDSATEEIFYTNDAGNEWAEMRYEPDNGLLNSWLIIDGDTIIVGGAVATVGNVQETTRGGSRPWDDAEQVTADAKTITSIAKSGDEILVGDNASQVFISPDGDLSAFEEVSASDIAGMVTATGTTLVAFGSDILYAASGDVVARCVVDPDLDWVDQSWEEIVTPETTTTSTATVGADAIKVTFGAIGDSFDLVETSGAVLVTQLVGLPTIAYNASTDTWTVTAVAATDAVLITAIGTATPCSGTITDVGAANTAVLTLATVVDANTNVVRPATIAVSGTGSFILPDVVTPGVTTTTTVPGLQAATGILLIPGPAATYTAGGELVLPATSTLYVVDNTAAVGMWRSLNPDEEDVDDVVCEVVTAELDATATLALAGSTAGSNVVWATDTTTTTNLWTYEDTLATEVSLKSPILSPEMLILPAAVPDTDKATLEWFELTGADEYEIAVNTTADFDGTDLSPANTDELSVTIENLDDGTIYYWKVRVAAGEPLLSRWSATQSFMTALEAVVVPAIWVPEVGAEDVSLSPSFMWTGVEGATSYKIQIATEPSFDVANRIVETMVTINAYPYGGVLSYNTTYYWRVKAYSGSLVVSDWTTGLFTTMAKPVPAVPPVEITPAPPAPVINLPAPVVNLPTSPVISPSWIYVIIGVGAVLVIAVIVLIVRTRRVA